MTEDLTNYPKHNALLETAEAALKGGEILTAKMVAQQLVKDYPSAVRGWAFLAAVNQLAGAPRKSISVLEQGIEINPDSALLHHMLASSLFEAAENHQAERHALRALEINPALSVAWTILGKLHARNARFTQAESAFVRAEQAAPNEPSVSLDLANHYSFHGNLAEAEEALRRADRSVESQSPSRTWIAYPALRDKRRSVAEEVAAQYLKADKALLALGHLEEAIALGANADVQDLFIRLLLSVRFSAPLPSLKPILARALRESWADAQQVGRLSAQLLNVEGDGAALTAKLAREDVSHQVVLNSSLARQVLTDNLLLALLEHVLVTDETIERLLTQARCALLYLVGDAVSGPIAAEWLKPFVVALASQCFISEYAYQSSPGEDRIFASLERRITASHKDKPMDPLLIGLVACYRPLHGLGNAGQLAVAANLDWLQPVIKQQIREPALEADLVVNFDSLTPIEHAISQAVEDHYDVNPFPRWIGGPGRMRPTTLSAWLSHTFGSAPPVDPTSTNGIYSALVAGCGTGLETTRLSRVFSDVSYFAIDLSRRSLAYAKRKSAELGIDNVEFARADLLHVGELRRSFDIVVCAGVLNHIEKPTLGLKRLADVVRPGGVMLVALYSATARRHVREAQYFAREGGYRVNTIELRRFRADVLSLRSDHTAEWRQDLLRRDDFYSLSMLRDLIFHENETNFNIQELQRMFKETELEFEGFSLDETTASEFRSRFRDDADLRSLPQWDIFEKEKPDTFWHMYHFMLKKPLY